MTNLIPAFVKHWWHTSVETAPPPIRFVDISYVKLVRKKGIHTEDVGSFIPELYVLANTPQGSLKCQIEEKSWAKQKWRNRQPLPTSRAYREALKAYDHVLFEKLYRSNGQRKTAFELAVIPSHRIADVERAVKTEFKFRRDKRLALPAGISKLRVIPDYLKNLSQADLAVKEFPSHIKVNIQNPVHKMSTLEKILHYSGQWSSLFMTIITAVAAGIALQTTSPWVALGTVVGMYLAKKCANDVGFFDIVEAFFRDLGWFFSKELSWHGKFSVRKALETSVYLAAVGLSAYLAGLGMWTTVMGLPLLQMPILQSVLAVSLTSVASLSTWVVGLATQRFFWGLSFWDNHIPLTKEMGNALVAHDTHKDMAATLKNALGNFVRKLNKHKHEKEAPELLRQIERNVKPVIKLCEARRDKRDIKERNISTAKRRRYA